MPIHDWTRVDDGTFHHFHVTWVPEISRVLNTGILPDPYYAMAEQIAGPWGPDVLALEANDFPPVPPNGAASRETGGVAVAAVAPRARVSTEAEMDDYVLKRRTIVIRHGSDERVEALLEIVPPGNKSSRHAIHSFVEKAAEALYRGYHLLIVDLFPPGPRDPHGIHAAIWGAFSDDPYRLPPDEPLTLAAYSAGQRKKGYIEPTAVGRELIEMPLFLTPETYVNVPLEATYAAAYSGVPRRWRDVLEAPKP